MSKRLLGLLLLSTVLHALLLMLPGFSPTQRGAGSQPFPAAGNEPGRISVRLRMLEATDPPLPIPAATEPKPAEHVLAPVEPTSPQDARSGSDAAAETPVRESPLPILPASLPHGFDRGAYLSADELDVRPTPEQPVIIPFDDALGIDRERGEVVLHLYVGEDGNIDLVDVERSDLPEPVAGIVTETFRNARMRPGMKAGKPVPARMKILVEFEVR